MKKIAVILLFLIPNIVAISQVSDIKNTLYLGINGGYTLNNIGFTPSIQQSMHNGFTVGTSLKFLCEKYFKTYCSLVAEINYTEIGWKESILDVKRQPVINSITQQAEEYSRTISYIQVPLFAHLAWGKENKGCQFFVQAGPQFGYAIAERTQMNFKLEERNVNDRANKTIVQDTMNIENKFDYGIAAGVGIEMNVQKIGIFQVEARYYYGLGNIYKDTKKDYFGKSNNSTIILKATYYFPLKRRE